MATLRDIRKRISSVKNIAKITSAMKMVAAAKMRKAQNAVTAARPYADKLAEMLRLLAADSEAVVSPFFVKRDNVRNICVIVVSADRGLCGGFNTNLLRSAEQHIRTLKAQYPKASIKLVTVGRKSTEYFPKRGYDVIARFSGVFTGLSFSSAQSIARIATNGFLTEEFDLVQTIGNEFKSMLKQEAVVRDFLPILPLEETQAQAKSSRSIDYIFEPTREEVLNAILPKHLNMHVWRTLLDSNAAEQAARMLAMDNATTNAKDLTRQLSLSYNKARQAAITKEILEVVGGAEALKG